MLHRNSKAWQKISLKILQKIHFKIKNYSESYLKYFSRLNISNEVAILIKLDKTFDKRLNLFMDILKIYSHIIK